MARLTKAQTVACVAIQKWCKRNELILIGQPRHVHSASYVIGYAAPGCLIVAVPFTESEPQVRDFDRQCPVKMIRKFDKSLKAGDWCHTAYTNTESSGEHVAVPIAPTEPGKAQEL